MFGNWWPLDYCSVLEALTFYDVVLWSPGTEDQSLIFRSADSPKRVICARFINVGFG